jgi:aromatic-L-amino-acid/L-tryptophan decarboxylase
MAPEEFRRYGHEVVDWIADYLRDIREFPVLPDLRPGDLVERLPSQGPEDGESMDAILKDFRELIVPAATHWNHPRFHGYFSISGSAPGILAESLIAALNMNGMLWKSSPAATELEQVTLGWLRQWLELPESFFGVIFDTASVGVLHAIVAAREAADPEARRSGHWRPLVVYTSEQAHSSIEKAAIAAGVGQDFVRKIPVDSEYRMRADALSQAIQADLDAQRQPFFVAATAGTTSVSSIDPVPAIADICDQYGLWLHVDGAYGGSAGIASEYRHILDGVERAASFVVSPQKWLFSPMDLSVLYTSRPEILRRAFTLAPEYLKTAEDSRAVNYMDYSLPLGRRFRSLKLWFILRYLGRKGAAELIRRHIGWAREFADRLQSDGRFELVAPVPLSLVCFRYKGTDEENSRLLDSINATGKAFLSHNVMDGRFVFRYAIGNIQTTKEDVDAVWELLRSAAGEL